MLDVTKVRAYLDKQRLRRQSNKVLHGHPSPVFWLDRHVSVPDVMRDYKAAARRVRKRVNLYVGTPYCLPTEPERCGFCLFPSEVYKDRRQLDVYLNYLKQEGDLYRPHLEHAELASIYFGGGTSNLYKADQYAELMRIVRDVVEVPPQIEVTLEGIPQTFSFEKLAAMKEAGITRISMGAQQLNDELIKLSGRHQKAEQVYQTLEWCDSLGLPASVDLIFGWPKQTPSHMLKDLKALVDCGVGHITQYELNVAGRTDFSRNRRSELPSVEGTLEMYHLGKEFLEAHGYVQVTPYDFERRTGSLPTGYLYEELFRRPFRDEQGELISFDAWGWGFAGISFFFGTPDTPGSAYLNQVHIDDYYRDLDQGRFPVMRGFRYTETDLRLHLLFQELQGLSVNRIQYRNLFGRDVVEEFRTAWQVLEQEGWVAIDADLVRIQGDGVFYLPLIQNLLAYERATEMRQARAPQVNVVSYAPVENLVARGLDAKPSNAQVI